MERYSKAGLSRRVTQRREVLDKEESLEAGMRVMYLRQRKKKNSRVTGAQEAGMSR